MKKLTIIDTFGFFFRSFYALPPLKSKSGFPTGLLSGFANLINSIGKDYDSDYLLFAIESKEKNLRKEIDPNYKAQRKEPPSELLEQIPIALEWIDKMGLVSLSKDGYEADDVIASVASLAIKSGLKVRVVSHDKDLYQLLSDGEISLFDPIKKIEIDSKSCIEKFGVEPKNFIDFQAIVGDSADNIAGVKGIGQKGAINLIEKYKNLESIYENIDEVLPKRARELLKASKEDAFRSRELVTLHKNLFDSIDFEDYRLQETNPLLKITQELIDLDMNRVLDNLKKNSLLSNSNSQIEEKRESLEFETLLLDTKEKLFEILEQIPKDCTIAFDTETTGVDVHSDTIVGFSFAFQKERAFYVPIAHSYLGVGAQVDMDSAKKGVERLFSNFVVGHNLKFDISIVKNALGVEPPKKIGDSMILAWLIEPESSIGLDNLMLRYFNHKMISFKETTKKGENFSTVPIESATKYAAEDALATYVLFFRLQEELKKIDKELIYLTSSLEFEFIKTLYSMEMCGIKIDIDFFENLSNEMDNKLNTLTKSIYEYCECEFNINSPKQLGEVLFDKLKLKGKKKTKSGYSTNESVLQSLKGEHIVIESLLEYRELFKLKSTYAAPLIKYAKQNSKRRIHTSFLQTGTATGRLSSKNPNLQNIPTRTDIGRRIREGFVASEGYTLLSLDYSQIELRLLAHFSQDRALNDAFLEGKDIHLETSKRVFGEESAKSKRDIAKSINFGLLYGMGARKLSQTLMISQSEAKEHIDRYFHSFPTVKRYIKELEESVLKRGYVKTLLGRYRYFNFSGVAEYQKLGYLREAVNTLFQGSAADLIKLSMKSIDSSIDYNSVKMLLQVHDELIFEIKNELVDEYSYKLKDIMEGVYKLNVPLVCGVVAGKNWGELK